MSPLRRRGPFDELRTGVAEGRRGRHGLAERAATPLPFGHLPYGVGETLPLLMPQCMNWAGACDAVSVPADGEPRNQKCGEPGH
jgi:hypothetical protein